LPAPDGNGMVIMGFQISRIKFHLSFCHITVLSLLFVPYESIKQPCEGHKQLELSDLFGLVDYI
jgi:hypothetical protein